MAKLIKPVYGVDSIRCVHFEFKGGDSVLFIKITKGKGRVCTMTGANFDREYTWRVVVRWSQGTKSKETEIDTFKPPTQRTAYEMLRDCRKSKR